MIKQYWTLALASAALAAAPLTATAQTAQHPAGANGDHLGRWRTFVKTKISRTSARLRSDTAPRRLSARGLCPERSRDGNNAQHR